MGLTKSINHITQPTDTSCTHAVLAMALGVDVLDVIKELGDPISNETAIAWLVRHDILPIPCDTNLHAFPLDGYYWVSVSSLNVLGTAHAVLVATTGDGFMVYDPNNGKKGKTFYPLDALSGGYPIMNSYHKVRYLKDCSK